MGITSPAAAYHIAFAADGCAHVEGDNTSAKLDQRYFIGDRVIAHAFSARIPAMLADLVDVALAVYLGDRLVPRRPRDADRYHLHWNRRLRLTIPVRDPGRWRAPALQARLRAVLAILTEDDWAFDFVPKTGPGRPAELQEYLFAARPDGPITAALFSGGLDSFAGLCHQLAARPGDHFVLFCGGTNRRALGMQRALTAALPLTTGRSITSMIVPFGLRRRGPRGYDGDERTQRARGFVFQCLGAATALQAGVRDLAIYEPGIGALNLPYTAAQLGAQSTRATDPRVLAAMGDFISAAVGRPFHLRLPFFGLTKAELCASVREVGLAGHIRDTFSCDGFPQRVAGRPQCGICTSCLLRRQALHVAGLADYDSWEGYRTNVFGTEPVASARLHAWRAMHDQVAVLRLALADPDPWHGLCFAFPQLLEVAACLTEPGPARTALTRRIVALYRRYCDEWRELPTRHGGARAIRAA